MTAKRKVILAILIVIVIVIVGFGLMVWRNSKTPPITADCGTGITTVYYTQQKSFLPSCIKVPAGTTITYTNQSPDTLAVGVNPHPIHNGNKQVSNGEFVLNVPSGESKETKLDSKGNFGIHDHNNSSSVAVIVVE
jgi:plastocyanin